MAAEPHCQLCAGALTKESKVWIQTSGSNALCYSLAWVCKNCGTCWPIGLTGGGLLKKWEPMWEKGKRCE